MFLGFIKTVDTYLWHWLIYFLTPLVVNDCFFSFGKLCICSHQKNWIYRGAVSGDLLQSHYYINWIFALNYFYITPFTKSQHLGEVTYFSSEYNKYNHFVYDLVALYWYRLSTLEHTTLLHRVLDRMRRQSVYEALKWVYYYSEGLTTLSIYA